MGFYADPLLRAARETIQSMPDARIGGSHSLYDLDQLAGAIEKAIKAALIENCGSIPQRHNHTHMVSICQSTGVWDVLPPALRGLIQEVETHRSTAECNSLSDIDSSSERLQKYFVAARRLIDYMEFHIIGNDSVLKRLKVD